MSKIVIFNGSARAQGGVSQILNKIKQGANEVGINVKVYDLNNSNIGGCKGCMYCKNKKVAICIQKDYLEPMYEDIQEAEAIVIGSPIYMYHISSQSQTWINRLYPLVDIEHNPLMPGKKLITVYSQGSPINNFFKSEMDYLKGIMAIMGWKEVERIINTHCMPTLYPVKVSNEILEKAYNIGKHII